jgi:hypothetical protein
MDVKYFVNLEPFLKMFRYIKALSFGETPNY